MGEVIGQRGHGIEYQWREERKPSFATWSTDGEINRKKRFPLVKKIQRRERVNDGKVLTGESVNGKER